MARAKGDKQYLSFAKGLITEASGLTYPEGSCRDLDNVDIQIDGSVRRRLGIAQERDGQAIGTGDLEDTLFTNDTGGPLSLSPSLVATTVTESYPLGDTYAGWTIASDIGAAAVVTGAIELGAQTGNVSWATRDLNIPDYDRITISWTSTEITSHEPKAIAIIGADSNGGGQGFRSGDNGIYFRTCADRRTGYVDVLLAAGNFEAPHTYYLTATKTGPNTYAYSLRVVDVGSGNERLSTTGTLGTIGDFLEFQATDGQGHRGTERFYDINILLEIFQLSGDQPDVTVPQYAFAVSTHAWPAPAGDGTKNFQVFQIANTLYFRDAEQEAVSNSVATAVPSTYATLAFDGVGTGFLYNCTSSQAAQIKLQSASGNGRIYFTSSAVVPFYAELLEDGTTIRLRACGVEEGFSGVRAITGQRLIRDFAGVEDGLEADENPGTLTAAHLYNLLNQGWPSARINSYFTDISSYPANNQQWFLGKDDLDAFDPNLLVLQDFGVAQAPRGRILLDALIGERDGQSHAVSGITSPIDFDDEQDVKAATGWEAIAWFAGRIWLAGEVNEKRSSGVYFSKTIETPSDAGKFYQQSDPSSEHFSDLLATDGGFIPIPEAGTIRRLVPFGSGLLVMADTGIWFVYGREGGFTANNFSVEKITNTGITGPDTVIRTGDNVLFWADNSIHMVAFGEQRAFLPIVQDLGETTVFKYYQLISRAARDSASSCYDPISKKAFWFWLSDANNDATYTSVKNRALIFDLRTGAFTTYSFAYEDTPLFGVCCGFARQTPATPFIQEEVYDSLGALVVDSLGATVTGLDLDDVLTTQDLISSIKLVVVSGSESAIRLAEFNSLDFADFEDFSNFTPVESSAYIVTGDDTCGTAQRNKQAIYVHSYFLRTERGFYADTTAKRASGCNMYARWNWNNSAAGNRWSESQPAYRYRKPYAPGNHLTDTFDTGEEIIVTKLKVRGKGRALALRYESVTGKDWRLLGITLPVVVNED